MTSLDDLMITWELKEDLYELRLVGAKAQRPPGLIDYTTKEEHVGRDSSEN
jgi:hypothetical protein